MTISFCIPTYDKGPYLDAALASIVKQAKGEHSRRIEICISDNASTDDTGDIVRKWQGGSPIPIRYHRNDRNRGFSYNLFQAISMARHDYCWILGSDDAIGEDGVSRIFEEVATGHDLYLCNRLLCDRDLVPSHPDRYLEEIDEARSFHLGDRKELEEYFRVARTLDAFFCFISSLIVRREIFEGVVLDDFLLANVFPHVYTILRRIAGHPSFRMKYIPEPLVRWRGDNSSFEGEGTVVRTYRNFHDLALIADRLYPPVSRLHRRFKAVLRRNLTLFMQLRAQLSLRTEQERNYRRETILLLAYPPPTRFFLLHLFPPPGMVRVGHRFYRKIKELHGQERRHPSGEALMAPKGGESGR